MSIPSAISSTVGSRPSSCSSEAERLPMRCSVPARFNGTRTMRDCSARAWRIAWRIHHTAYEMNLIPFVSSNLWAARIRPRLPSLIKSESDTPWFWYFLATDTTNRRLDRTSLSSASGSCCLIRWASATSSSRVISGYWLISRRYWSSDPSSNEARFAVFNCMAVSPLRAGTTPRDTGRPAAQVVLLPVELRIVHAVPRIDPLHVGLHRRRAVHPDRAPAHLDPVARHADDALHIVQFGILRVGEHDDVAAARRLEPWEPRV